MGLFDRFSKKDKIEEEITDGEVPIQLKYNYKIHYTTSNGLMYYDGCPLFDENGEWITYEEFMQPKQPDTKRNMPESVRDVLGEGSELD